MKKQLRKIATVHAGYPFRERLQSDPQGNVLVIQMKNLDEGNRIQEDGVVRVQLGASIERHLVKSGDIVFRARGNRTSASLVTRDLGRTIVAAPLMIIRAADKDVLPAYLQWAINNPRTQAKLADLGTGTYVQTVGKAALEALELPVPDLERQHKIVELAALMEREQQLWKEISESRKRLVDGILLRRAQDTR
jgi:hypothetical protein